MYRQKYRIRRSNSFSMGDRGRKYKCVSKRQPWYGKPRRRPRSWWRDFALRWRAIQAFKDEEEERLGKPPGGSPASGKPPRDDERLGKPPGQKPPAEKPKPEEPDSDEEDDAPEVPEVEVKKRLHVEDIDLHIQDNTKAHHTDRYECTQDRTRESDGLKQPAELVIRRGQEFNMTIIFDRPYSIKNNDITLIFSLGDEVSASRGCRAVFRVDETGGFKYKPKKWGAKLISKKGNSLTVSVFVPASAPIGEWEFSVKTREDVKDGKDLIWQYNHNEDINIICNPWCKEDLVYLEDEKWRNEAVLNDNGAQYFGNRWSIGAKAWSYGQFENGILDASFHLVRKAFAYHASAGMGNAVTLARYISQMVNNCDDDGVLIGNWSGEYSGGKSPTSWTGSVKILRQYMETGKPVKYGQCWVFSAVTTTVCRALGIPCRSLTNISSAHNTDMDHLGIDKLVSGESSHGTRHFGDSIWNFHVWNEVWMARPDLDEGSKEWDGWQVIDATPQEASDGVYCCGPAPVKAIKEGRLRIGKDTAFIFAEVNANKNMWDEKNGELVIVKKYKDAVGLKMLTHKATGKAVVEMKKDKEELDLCEFYKYPEGSQKELDIVKKAEKLFQVMNGTVIVTEEEEEEEEEVPVSDIKLEIVQPPDQVVGNPFDFIIHITNTTNEKKAIKDVVMKVLYKTYDDSTRAVALKKKVKDIMLEGGQKKTMNTIVDEHVTTAHPEDSFNFELQATVSFYDDQLPVVESTLYRLRRPDVEITGPKTCKMFSYFDITMSFTNPLNAKLTDCKLDFEGGLVLLDHKEEETINIPDIAPKKTWKQVYRVRPKVQPYNKPDRVLSVAFESTQISDVDGSYTVEIQD